MKTIVSLVFIGIALPFHVHAKENAAQGKTTAALKPAELKVLESYKVPAVEISGMAWRFNSQTKRRELVLVGDRNHKVHIIDWENRKIGFSAKEIDLLPLEKESGSVSKQSEWESVFSDMSGRLYIIQENPPAILVVASDLSKIEKRIDLVESGKSKDTLLLSSEQNSGGEGIMPLKNGHVLVVKEKDPLQILEFAPIGGKASGYNPNLSIEREGIFPLTSTTLKLENVFSWSLRPEHEVLFEDSSGINVDKEGRLYLLGDQQKLIGRLGGHLRVDQKIVEINKLWSLPSIIKQPEGMVIDDHGRPIVAIDRKNTKKNNLFLLTPLK